MSIRELKVDDECGVIAISMVDYPAVEENFMYFAANKRTIRNVEDITEKDLDNKYKWVLGSSVDVCPACIDWSNQQPKTLRNWIETALPRVPIDKTILNLTTKKSWEGTPVTDGPVYNTFCGDACKCHLEYVDTPKQKFSVEFSIENAEKRELVGLVLRSNQMIYRHNIGNGSPGYVYFSSDTVRKAQSKFGYNRNVTFQHVDNRTGSVIMMKSWIDETPNDVRWMVKYKVIDNNLWKMIKDGVIKGFSLEGSFK